MGHVSTGWNQGPEQEGYSRILVGDLRCIRTGISPHPFGDQGCSLPPPGPLASLSLVPLLRDFKRFAAAFQRPLPTAIRFCRPHPRRSPIQFGPRADANIPDVFPVPTKFHEEPLTNRVSFVYATIFSPQTDRLALVEPRLFDLSLGIVDFTAPIECDDRLRIKQYGLIVVT